MKKCWIQTRAFLGKDMCRKITAHVGVYFTIVSCLIGALNLAASLVTGMAMLFRADKSEEAFANDLKNNGKFNLAVSIGLFAGFFGLIGWFTWSFCHLSRQREEN